MPKTFTVNNQPLKNAFVDDKSAAKIFVNDILVYNKITEEPPTEEGNYVIFENEDANTISVTPKWTQEDVEIQYSFNGSDWSSATHDTEIENTTGNQIAFRGKAPTDKRLFTGYAVSNAWDCPNTTKITGNLNFLLCDEFGDETAPTTIAERCYDHMFYNCTSLTTAPELPATTLDVRCYNGMFRGCTSLTTAPELPATTLTLRCYNSMFFGCTSLTTAPELPATTLADWCYSFMFRDCTGLTTAPELPATTLVDYCYRNMFYDCTSFKVSETQTGDYQQAWRIPTSGTGTTAENWNSSMLSGTTGTFTSNPSINTTYYVENEPV